jgi:hypothetical protein
MRNRIRVYLIVEAAAFATAALIHSGRVISGYAHREAFIAETVIAAVLAAGILLTWMRPGAVRGIGLAAQGFALFWTLVGVVMIAVGVGPRTAPDVAYHAAIVLVLIAGLLTAWRARPPVRVV